FAVGAPRSLVGILSGHMAVGEQDVVFAGIADRVDAVAHGVDAIVLAIEAIFVRRFHAIAVVGVIEILGRIDGGAGMFGAVFSTADADVAAAAAPLIEHGESFVILAQEDADVRLAAVVGEVDAAAERGHDGAFLQLVLDILHARAAPPVLGFGHAQGLDQGGT